jgi:hypothetical protein
MKHKSLIVLTLAVILLLGLSAALVSGDSETSPQALPTRLEDAVPDGGKDDTPVGTDANERVK